jgi:hypothetical protein
MAGLAGAVLAVALGWAPAVPAGGAPLRPAAPATGSLELVSATAGPTTTTADDAPALLILMDVSSSMSEADATGKVRIEGAKEAVTDFISTLPTTTRVGLDAYPDDGGCGEGSSLIPIAAANLAEMDRTVRTLSPDGDTPTGLALRKAAADLQAAGAKTGVIILVSDGESNCEGTSPPPCEVAQELAGQGIDVTVNTVGFQISDAGREELNCVAEATGGAYVDVASGEDLSDAITDYSVPSIDISVTPADRTVTLEAGARNTVEVQGTVTNTGPIPAPNVQATITYDATFSPGSAKPRVRLGNLAPGESRTVAWTIRPTDEYRDQTVEYTARALTTGAVDEQKGEIRFRPADRTDDLPAWLLDARDIVVMGDSYSSGEGVANILSLPQSGAYDEPTDRPRNSCHRSNAKNYGGQLAALLGTRARVHTLACSGAVTADLALPQDLVNPGSYHTVTGYAGDAPLPSQLKQFWALKDDPDLILMTIGGNDALFGDITQTCLLPFDCSGYLRQLLPTIGAIVEQNVGGVYADVDKAARNKTGASVPILAPAYPLPFPTDASGRCDVGVGDLAMSPRERAFMNDFVTAVNDGVERAARAAQDDGIPVWFIDRTAATYQDGHTYCDRDPWINRISATALGEGLLDGLFNLKQSFDEWFAKQVLFWEDDDKVAELYRDRVRFFAWKSVAHPNPAGYRAEAVQIMTWATEHPSLAARDKGVWSQPYAPNATIASTEVIGEGEHPTLRPGTTVAIRASGFAPGSPVAISLGAAAATGPVPAARKGGPSKPATPDVLGVAIADSHGSVRVIAVLRRDLPATSTRLYASGLDRSGKRRVVDVPADVERPLPSWWWPGMAAAGVLGLGAVGCGGAFAWTRRRGARAPEGEPAGAAP